VTDAVENPAPALQEVAYLHEPYWNVGEGAWLKSLLLFFDGIAILVPGYMRDRPLYTDPTLAQPLSDQGLLHRLRPETLVGADVATALTDLLDSLIADGAFDDLEAGGSFAELSYSRLGGLADPHLVEIVQQQLRERGLARESEDGVSIPLHPSIRALVLAALPQLVRGAAEADGLALQPVTGNPRSVRALMASLDLPGSPTRGSVVSADLEQVMFNLDIVPLDEVLDFRRQHGASYRSYARDLRRFVRGQATLEEDAREVAFADRREAIVDAADELRRLARKAWRRPLASFGLGIAGSAVALSLGNPIGAGISASAALLGLQRRADPATAYSYLFQVQERLSR